MIKVSALSRPGLGPISFQVSDGACLAITGPSGAGKSLLLRAIVDLDRNSATVTTGKMNRAQVDANTWRRAVAMLPAESGWWAEDVISHFTKPDETRKLLPDLGLPPEALDWQVANLSTGERHRLALLRLLEVDPEVLMLDEPTAALDRQNTVLVETLLHGLLARGKTIVMVTHDPEQPTRMGAQVLTLENGVQV